jgi:type I restriction enzyme, S subunit
MRASYPTYKSTSIPWLPEMPEHWDALKAKHIFKERSEKGYPDEPLLAATQTKGVVRKEEYETRTVTVQKDFHLLKLVKEEDFVISLRSFQGGIEYAYHRGIISPAYTIFYERNKAPMNKAFYRHLFKSHPFINSLTLFVTGIREGQNIDYAEFKDSLLPSPPLTEQTAIANYLDAKTEQINRFIEKKQKLIALLKEQKQAVINELLEDKEGKWERRKLKYFVIKVGSGITPSGGATVYKDSGIPLLRSQNIHNEKLELSDVAFISQEVHDSMSGSKVKAGDVLLNITGGSLGRCYYATEELGEANVNQHVSIIRPHPKKVKTQFLQLLLISEIGSKQIWREQTGSGREGLNGGAIKNLVFPMPKIEEQIEVISTIQKETSSIDAAISQIEKEVEKVRELKQSLIAEVVTGRIKVV